MSFLKRVGALSLPLLAVLSVSAGAAPTAKGTVLFCDLNGGLYTSRLEDWKPQKSGTYVTAKCARFSHDGKLIAILTADKKIKVVFNDFSAATDMGVTTNPAHAEAWIITWVKGGVSQYEVAYPSGNSIDAVPVNVDFTSKKITAGTKRTIGKNLVGLKPNTIQGASFVYRGNGMAGPRIFTRTSWAAEFHTMPNNTTVATWKDSYMWIGPDPALAGGDLKMCHPSMSRDGEWVSMVHHTGWEEKGRITGSSTSDHAEIALMQFLKPGDPAINVSNNYILVPSPGFIPMISYHWTNHPRFLIAGGEVDKQVYLLELATYPPQRESGKTTGKYTWTKLATSGLAGAPFGMDIWIDAGVEDLNWLDGTKWTGEQGSSEIVSGQEGASGTNFVNKSASRLIAVESAKNTTGAALYDIRGVLLSKGARSSGIVISAPSRIK